jgi:hypothetical protein
VKENYVILSDIETEDRAKQCIAKQLDYVTMKPLIPDATVSYYIACTNPIIDGPTNFLLQKP